MLSTHVFTVPLKVESARRLRTTWAMAVFALSVICACAKSVAAPAPPPPEVPPPSVPDNVNPFADENNLPKPLKLPAGIPLRLNVDVHPENFDGLTVMQMVFNGPNFEWVFDPLSDWTLAPTSSAESVAFIYEANPKARLALTLYAAKDFIPEITTPYIIQYLAAVRDSAPQSFVLLTPIAKGTTNIGSTYFANFGGQGVAYAMTSPAVSIHHLWFVDLNHEYLLLIDLMAPSTLIDKLDAQVRFTLGRSKVRKGLGSNQPPAAPAASDSAAPAPKKD